MSLSHAWSILNRPEVWLAVPLLLGLLNRRHRGWHLVWLWTGILLLCLHLLTIPGDLIAQWFQAGQWRVLGHPVTRALVWCIAYAGGLLVVPGASGGRRGRDWVAMLGLSLGVMVVLTLESPWASLAMLGILMVFSLMYWQDRYSMRLVQHLGLLAAGTLVIFGVGILLPRSGQGLGVEQRFVEILRRQVPDLGLLLALPGEGHAITPGDFGRPPSLTSRQIYSLEVSRPGTYYLAEQYAQSITDAGWYFAPPPLREAQSAAQAQTPESPAPGSPPVPEIHQSPGDPRRQTRVTLRTVMGYQNRIPRPRTRDFLESTLLTADPRAETPHPGSDTSGEQPSGNPGDSPYELIPRALELSELVPPGQEFQFGLRAAQAPDPAADQASTPRDSEPGPGINHIQSEAPPELMALVHLPDQGDFNANTAQLRRIIQDRFTYSLEVEGISRGSHPLSGFFSQQQGYCLHFATLAALYYNQLGYTLRFVEGFVLPVSYQDLGKPLGITGKHSHTWVEVLDEDGFWRIAELTPREGLLGPDTGLSWRSDPGNKFEVQDDAEGEARRSLTSKMLLPGGVVVVVLLTAGFVLWWQQPLRRWNREMVRLSKSSSPDSPLRQDSLSPLADLGPKDRSMWLAQLYRWYGYGPPEVSREDIRWLGRIRKLSRSNQRGDRS